MLEPSKPPRVRTRVGFRRFRVWLWLLVVLSAAALLGLAYRAYQVMHPPLSQYAEIYPKARPLSPFSLQSSAGDIMTPQQLQGHWTLVFVGYTSCPDICPMTMAMLAGAVPQLTQHLPAGEQLEIWFISVDPKRDTAEQLAQYLAYFNQPAIKAMTASHDRLMPLVRELNLSYAIHEPDQAEYLVSHTAAMALLNPQGALVGRFLPMRHAEQQTVPVVSRTQLLHDFPIMLARLAAQ